MIELYLSAIAPALNATILGPDVKFTGCSTDTRHLKPNAIYVALKGENFDGHDFVKDAQAKRASSLIVEHPVSCDLPTLLVANTRKALGDLANYWRKRFNLTLVAITGSNGKTTTKEMVKNIFTNGGDVLANQGNFNNDIGVPLTLFNLHARHRYAVIEMGANHPGEIANLTHIAQPNVATITQCAPAHLEGFKTIEGVARAKGEIFTNLPTNATAIINNDDPYANLWHELAVPHLTNTFAQEQAADITATNVQLANDHSDFTLQTPAGNITIHLPLPGRHNIMNAMAASTCALACGSTLNAVQQGLQNMQPVQGRLQICKGIKNITLINDTYNANPTSLAAALAVLSQNAAPRWLVLGDMGELGTESIQFHQQAGQKAREIGIERLFAIGTLSSYVVTSFGNGAQHFDHHEDLVQSLYAQLPANATVLIKGSRGMQMEKVVNALQENA